MTTALDTLSLEHALYSIKAKTLDTTKVFDKDTVMSLTLILFISKLISHANQEWTY